MKNLNIKPGLLVVITLGVLISSSVDAQQKSSLTGSWKFQREGLTGAIKCQLRLVQQDGKWVGEYQDADKVEAKVSDIKFADQKVSLNLNIADSTVTLSGTLKKDKITGTIVDGDDKQDWKATRFTALQDAVGKWRMEFTTPDGAVRRPEFQLSMTDDEATVEFTAGEDEEVDGEGEITKTVYKDGLLIFHVELQFQGQPLKLEYELELEENSLEGSMYFEVEGTEMAGDVDVSGERID